MRVLVIEPNEKPVVKEIGNSLKEMQSVVGGSIEPVYYLRCTPAPGNYNFYIYCYSREA